MTGSAARIAVAERPAVPVDRAVAVPAPELLAPRVALRRYRESDAGAVWEAIEESRPRLKRWLPSIARRTSADEVRAAFGRLEAWWEGRVRLIYGVRDRQSGRFLGEVGLYDLDWKRGVGEVGYWLREGSTGHGYMREALSALCRESFSTLGMVRLEALIQPDNRPSLAVAEQAGFQLSGYAPARPERDGTVAPEVCIYALDDPSRAAGPPPGIAIRPAVVEDAERIATIRIESWQWAYLGVLPQTYLTELPLSFDRRRDWWRNVISRPPSGARIWVAADDGGVVGYLACGPARDADLGPTPEIYEFYVSPDRTGAGTGGALLAHAEMELARAGNLDASLWVFAENERGRRFYGSAGWREDGARKASVWGRGPVGELRLRKHLPPPAD